MLTQICTLGPKWRYGSAKSKSNNGSIKIRQLTFALFCNLAAKARYWFKVYSLEFANAATIAYHKTFIINKNNNNIIVIVIASALTSSDMKGVTSSAYIASTADGVSGPTPFSTISSPTTRARSGSTVKALRESDSTAESMRVETKVRRQGRCFPHETFHSMKRQRSGAAREPRRRRARGRLVR